MIKKTLLFVGVLALSGFSTAFAGGYLTNTNQSARFGRLFALESMTNAADAAYYNPAGTIKLSEGFHFTFSNQSAFQERIINSEFSQFAGGGKRYVGKASAPVIPSLQGVYRKGNWALSGNIGLIGGGGKATFNDGLPMFEAPVSILPGTISQLTGGAMPASGYQIDQYMTGANYFFGGQLGGTYKINDMFSVYGGFRMNVVHNKYEGYLRNLKVGVNEVMINPESTLDGILKQLNDMNNQNPSAELQQKIAGLNLLKTATSEDGAQLEAKQSGWGVAPIIGAHFSYKGLNIGAKYEFRTSLDIENKTKRDDTGQFRNGVNTAHDIPALLAIGASYDIIEPLTVSFGYHHFFDKQADMAVSSATGVGKQKSLTGGTNEYLFGVEWRIDRMFTVSGGGQVTRYGLADAFQSDLSFSVSSYSLGLGGAVNVSKNVQLNASYFFTDYENYTKTQANYNGSGLSGADTYTRKNKVFAVGVDFSF